MKIISVKTPSKKYEVRIEKKLLLYAGTFAAEVRVPGKAVIVTDSNVNLLYSDMLDTSLRKAGFEPVKYVFTAGEQFKNAVTYIGLLNFMAESRLTRTDTVFALGGGVTGDLAGFAAATYMRGIGLIQIPTTLLADVDSSVGGKTAIDLDEGKNLAGAFYQPDMVICDPETLSTLPKNELSNGYSEVIKYGIIRDAALITSLGDFTGDTSEDIIARCVEIKRDIVCADEREAGERQILNFGHTFGHAVEKCSGYMIPHGNAVAIGMMVITKACVKKGLCPVSCLDETENSLRRYGLPLTTEYDTESLFAAVLSDKKRSSDRLTLVIPRDIGVCELKSVSLLEAKEFLRLGLER
ncbi:3-dehydroquinate synthase [bioreactor metagenome]|uniref:3-dehydroquinate synthase n=1 Tax=bioreactor metagenome TaxID=1076179 RepID=A0A645C4U3_9ZZZZ|nr:3-dehydroquinate synthase [Oscillospiraceae bacterium]